jgi:hypothetical protein
MPLTANITFTVQNQSVSGMQIKANGIYRTDSLRNTAQTAGMEIVYDLEGTMQGNYEITIEGWISEATVRQKINGMLKFVGNELIPEGMEIPISIDVRYQIKGEKKS